MEQKSRAYESVHRGSQVLKTPKAWLDLDRHVQAYWERFATAHGRAVPFPVAVYANDRGTVSLGGELALERHEMATPLDARDLFKKCVESNALMLGSPPSVACLAHQTVSMDSGPMSRPTVISYKYTTVVSPPSRTESAFAIRIESEGKLGHNSWLLNHPIHHIQLGTCGDLRIINPIARSLTAFIDLMLRTYDRPTWAELYPNLNHALSRHGAFKRWVEPAEELPIGTAHSQEVEKTISAGLSSKDPWALELELWRKDIALGPVPTPELFLPFLG